MKDFLLFVFFVFLFLGSFSCGSLSEDLKESNKGIALKSPPSLSTLHQSDVSASISQSALLHRVTIYFSAGEHSKKKSCHRLDTTGCDLYSLNINLSTKEASHAKVIANSSVGEIFPALSPNNSFIAYEKRSNGKNKPGQIALQKVSSTAVNYVTYSKTAPQSGRYPHWRSDQKLVFDRVSPSDSAAGKLYNEPYVDYEHWTNTFIVPISTDSSANPILGTSALKSATLGGFVLWYYLPIYIGDVYRTKLDIIDTTEYSLHDTFINPKNRYQIAGHAYIASNCSDNNCGETTPLVIDMNPILAANRVKEFDMSLGNGKTLDACAHVAFRGDGEKVICTDQHTDFNGETYYQTVGVDTPQRIRVKRDILYRFAWDSTQGKYVIDPGVTAPGEFYDRALFRPKSAQELTLLNPNFPSANAPNKDGDYCVSIVHKSAEYCGNNNHVIVRVHCLGTTGSVLFSRIYLINISDKSNPIYTDINSKLETLLGKSQNTYFGQAGTCSSLGGISHSPESSQDD